MLFNNSTISLLGKEDGVNCYFCNGGLVNWLPGDDPVIEHARWYPECIFIARTQGRDFARKVKQGENVVSNADFYTI